MSQATNSDIRNASPSDAMRIQEIYRHYVQSSHSTFETTAPAVDEVCQRILKSQTKWSWLVIEAEGQVVGYAYGGPFRLRDAYRYSVETSIYLDHQWVGRGLATRLYTHLIADLEKLGYRNAYAGITLQNPASIHLHRKVGFSFIGVFPKVGWKFEQWHDVSWWHRCLNDQAPE